MRRIGLHLLQDRRLAAAGHRSALAAVDRAGALTELRLLDDDREIVAAIGPEPALVVVDAPLVAPAEGGRRDLERVLAWCDINLLPVSRRRLIALTGGIRGEELTPLLAEALDLWEGSPDQLLRQLIWEEGRDAAEPLPLERYRLAWPSVRAPRYRPKGPGPTFGRGLAPAWRLLSGVLDLGGWAPGAADGPDQAADAARLDAIALAALAHRRLAEPPTAVTLGDHERGRIIVASGPELADRIERTLARMRADGTIAI